MTQSHDPLYASAYTLRETVRLTGIPFGTLHSWTSGKQPIIRLAERRKGVSFWSFTNVVEAVDERLKPKVLEARPAE